MTVTLSDLDRRLTNVERKIIKHDEDIRVYGGMIIDTNTRVRGLERKFDRMNGRMDRFEGSLGLIARALGVELPEWEPEEPELPDLDDQLDPELVD
jgi:hypothetical protein